jgi:2,4-dienoyl-CoA reductase (NADPH2)
VELHINRRGKPLHQGGGLVGLELAEYLVERRRKVTILEPGPSLGAELAIVRRARVLHMLNSHGVDIHRGASIVAIDKDKVRFEVDDEQHEASCKQVIIAMGALPDNTLLLQLQNDAAQVHSIGDCRDVGYIDGAMLDARNLVRQLETT